MHQVKIQHKLDSEFTRFITFVFLKFCSEAQKVSVFGVLLVHIFYTFGLDTEIYSANLCIHYECEKMWTSKNSEYRTFSRCEILTFSKFLASMSNENIA